MYKVTDKRFLKYIDLTKKDIEEIGSTEFATELKNILKTKMLTTSNIQTLFPFLLYRKNHPEHYTKELKAALNNGGNFAASVKSISKLEEEHSYMYQYISQFYSIEELSKDFHMIVPKAVRGEVV